jgi:hypothetical protein
LKQETGSKAGCRLDSPPHKTGNCEMSVSDVAWLPEPSYNLEIKATPPFVFLGKYVRLRGAFFNEKPQSRNQCFHLVP